MRKSIIIAIAASALVLGACQNDNADDQGDSVATVPGGSETDMAASGPSAIAPLMTADGQPAGEARLTEGPDGLTLALEVRAIPSGNHGVHIHTTGQCDGPGFESAGGHWNPTNKNHGVANDNGSHLGDFVNLEVAADGTGRFERPISGATLSGENNALLDDDGAAFIIHAGRDDQVSDPSGNSGARLACGVFTLTSDAGSMSAAN